MRQNHHRSHSHHSMAIDKYAYCSRLKEWNSSGKAAFAVASLIAVLAADSIKVSLMTIVFMGILSVFGGRIGMTDYLRLLAVPGAFIVLGTIAVLIQFGAGSGDIVFRIPFGSVYMYVTQASIWQSISLATKAFAAFSAIFLLTLSTPMGEIIMLLRRLHIPELIIELMHLIYRYIFILFEVMDKQNEAAQSRLGYYDKRTAFHTIGSQAAGLFVVSMKKAEGYYDALESRGYDGRCMFWEEKRPVKRGQVFSAAVYAAGVLLMICI